MNYRYNLDAKQAQYVIDKKKLVVVVPLNVPYGYKFERIKNKGLEAESAIFRKSPDDIGLLYPLPYPICARVGLRETWACRNYLGVNGEKYWHKATFKPPMECSPCGTIWRSSQCQPVDAIRHWFIVEESRVCELWKVTYAELMSAGCREDERTEDWFNARYHGAWNKNPWVQVAGLRRE